MAPIEIKRHPDGTRYVRPYLGTNAVTGRPLRPYHRFPSELTDEQCLEEALRWLDGLAPATGKLVGTRLGDLLARYVDDLEVQGAPANTVKAYRTLARYAGPLASRDARGLKVGDIEGLYRALLTEGGADGGGLSDSTVLALHWFLRGAFGWLAALGIVDASPVAYAMHPRPAPTEAAALDGEALASVAAAIAHALGAPASGAQGMRRRSAAFAAYLGLNMGLRCGEACAVRPCDVWADRLILHVGGTVVEPGGPPVRQGYTKGKRPRNVAITDDDLAVIEAQRARCALLPGHSPKTPLATLLGSYMRPSRVAADVSALFREAGVQGSFHTLRHTHATWLLAHGMDLKTVSERLGHRDEATTLRIYSHVMPGRDAAAAELFRQAGGLR